MYKFLRGFGLGLLYALVSPFLVAGFAVIAVIYGVPNFIVRLIKAIINFFQGKPLFPPFPEDEAANAAQEARSHPQDPAPQPSPAPTTPTTNVYLQTNFYPNGNGAQPGQQPAQTVPPVQPQPSPSVSQQPQPTYIDTTIAPTQPESQQIPGPQEAIFGGELLENKKEDKQ